MIAYLFSIQASKIVYRAQAEHPSPGYLAELLKEKFDTIEGSFEETGIKNISEKVYKQLIKSKLITAAKLILSF